MPVTLKHSKNFARCFKDRSDLIRVVYKRSRPFVFEQLVIKKNTRAGGSCDILFKPRKLTLRDIGIIRIKISVIICGSVGCEIGIEYNEMYAAGVKGIKGARFWNIVVLNILKELGL